MSANIETMFYVREKPWHGLGTEVKEAPTSADALVYADLDWLVEQKNVYAEDGTPICGYKVNVRSTDNATLGIVSDRYKVVQNEDAFQFTDDLLGAGVTYETAGALQGGRKVWMLARMPHRYIIAGDEIAPYLVVMNSHDGSSGIKVAMTPIRVVCQNTLNLALNSAKRIWTTKHTENVMSRVHEAEETLGLAEKYMGELGRGIDNLSQIKLSDRKVAEFMQEFFPVTADLPEVQRKNNLRLLEDMKRRYWDAPDLSNVGKNGYRFVNAVSDFATHANPMGKPTVWTMMRFGRIWRLCIIRCKTIQCSKLTWHLMWSAAIVQRPRYLSAKNMGSKVVHFYNLWGKSSTRENISLLNLNGHFGRVEYM